MRPIYGHKRETHGICQSGGRIALRLDLNINRRAALAKRRPNTRVARAQCGRAGCFDLERAEGQYNKGPM